MGTNTGSLVLGERHDGSCFVSKRVVYCRIVKSQICDD
jgi:hypothetical protein